MQILNSHPDLEAIGLTKLNRIYWQLHTPQFYEEIIRNQDALLAHLGPLVARTGDHTGRSPKDRFIVREPSTENEIWWGKVNQPFDANDFERLLEKVQAYFQGRSVYVENCYAGADPDYRLPVRVITESAWHALFAHNMFIQVHDDEELENFQPGFTVIHAPNFHATPEHDGTNSAAFVLINLAQRIVLIGGTSYAGEIKKSIFSVLNFYLPRQGVMPMHCSANAGEDGDVALFFGLSGTGKTTLSADSSRILIGDDEHGWSDRGVFNFEGGCYAKVIRLSPTGEPEIYQATRRFGTILENVAMDMRTRYLDLDDARLTENTRASYPISHIPNATRTGMGGHPNNVIFLTADAFGVMPPVAKLTTEQAMYHFLSGYTAKVAGTEKGLSNEPQATFSACFGEPFMPLHPKQYAELLGEKIRQHNASVWLVNTGWTGGPYGVGQRMELGHTRAIIRAILEGRLDGVETREDPNFGLHVPVSVPDVPGQLLDPRQTWSDPAAYDEAAAQLAARFVTNFERYAGEVSDAILAVQPTAEPQMG
jgi:phosphoenolpyruvate carboxykinase (ATP)